MNFKTLTCAAGMLLMSATSSFAIPMNFNFSFYNTAYDGGLVTGIIRGLEDGESAAESVEILSNTGGWGIGEYVGSPEINNFTVTAGEITVVEFLYYGADNSSPDVTASSLILLGSLSSGVFFGLSASAGVVSDVLGTEISFTAVPISVVPLPAGFVLSLTGLAGLAGVSRWKKRGRVAI